MLTRLLVAMSPGYHNNEALERAKWLAQQKTTEPTHVMLYSAVYDETTGLPGLDSKSEGESIVESMLRSQERHLDTAQERLAGVCEHVEVCCEWNSSASQGIARAARSFDAELILLQANPHLTIARWFRTNVDWQLLRECEVPLLLCHDTAVVPYRRALAAVTPSEHESTFRQLDDRILTRATALAEQLDIPLLVGTACASADLARLRRSMPPVCSEQQWRDEHRRALDQLLTKHGVAGSQGLLVEGDAVPGILSLAQTAEADLIIMGALAESKLDGRSIGLIAEKVIADTRCDVLIEHG